MNISVKGEYALQAIFDLASHARKDPIRIADIARRQHIPQKFLELILASLKNGGFVESRRGAEGGYLLAKSADAITVGDVLRFVEGRQEERSKQRRNPASPFCDIWQRADEAVAAIIDSATFAQLARDWAEKHSQFVPNWEI